MLKVRTMVPDAEAVLLNWQETRPDLFNEFIRCYKIDDDPRITPLGRFLRRCSLDELPQLINVVLGHMSLVGPRPVVSNELALYGNAANLVLQHRPGVTGPWQIGGRNKLSSIEKCEMDVDYVTNTGLSRDLRILCATILVPFKYDGL